MPITVLPYIPEYITVHLGTPGSGAENVTVSFPDYIKNVASSEIYPTWEPAALRANILAQISFALNRVYTEYYPSRGYSFHITNSTATDQKFIYGRNIFDNIEQIVDDIFNTYIRRIGYVEPLAAKFCNGTTTTCDGLSQWGSQYLAQDGFDSMQILRTYYGDGIELVPDAPVQGVRASYPGSPLRQGSAGEAVVVVQTSLNRISQDYPAIPKIWPVDGIFGPATENAVKRFQSIFNLTADGVVGRATWYKLVLLYVGVKDLAELVSEGQTFYNVSFQYPGESRERSSGDGVVALQFMLAVLSEFYDDLPFLPVDGVFGPRTRQAVTAFQQMAGLPQTGVADETTWDAIYEAYAGAASAILSDGIRFPTELSDSAAREEFETYALSTRLTQFPGYPLSLGSRDRKGGAA